MIFIFILSTFQKVFISLIFNNCDAMKEHMEKFLELNFQPWSLLAGHLIQCFVFGLISIRLFRETNNPLWAERAKTYQERIALWKDQGSKWNLEHKLCLLEAEEAYNNSNLEKAQLMYERAVSLATEHKFPQEAALSAELAGYFYLNTGNRPSALQYFSTAYMKYEEWGALAKVRQLSEFVEQTFGINFASETSSWI